MCGDCHAVMYVVYWIEMGIKPVESYKTEVFGGMSGCVIKSYGLLTDQK